MHRPRNSFGSIRAKLPLCYHHQRIGLLGGSFNPAHDGHLQISRIALRRLQLDKVWWLVTPGNPLKDHAALPTLTQRMRQCRAIARDPRIEITGFEQYLSSAYTASTLDFLKLRAPQTRFVWIMGADNLAFVHHWRSWRRIFAAMPIAIVDRPGWHLRAMSSKAAKTFQNKRIPGHCSNHLATMPAPTWTILNGPLSTQSSTALRRNLG